MAKHLLKFDTAAEYSAATIETPAVSWITGTDEVKYDPYIPTPSHDYVDLGLPSGTKWATMNIGANSITDTGLYFQWGDISGYTAAQVGSGAGQKFFGWADYKYGNGGDSPSDMTKYTCSGASGSGSGSGSGFEGDGLCELLPVDDAAVANMGGSWRMPTKTDFNELLNTSNCTNAWVTNYNGSGVNGYLFTSVRNSNTLFFPAAGDCGDGSVYGVGSYCGYWSSSLDTSNVVLGYHLFFNSGGCYMSSDIRRYGYAVRGVVG